MKNWQIPFRNDSYQMALGIVQDTKERILCTRDATYRGSLAERAEIMCTEENGVLQICCRLLLKSDLYADRLFLRLGIDCYMESYPQWDEKFFPTLIRCEKNGVWGCFVSPAGKHLALASPSPFISWKNEYERGIDVGHRIYTVSLDMLNRFPQPKRHPQAKNVLKAGEHTYRVFLGFVPAEDDVYDFVQQYACIKICRFGKYTLEEWEKPAPLFHGDYRLENTNGRCVVEFEDENAAQSRLYFRKPWSYYLKCAAQFAAGCQQKSGTHTESWYGYFTQAEYAIYSGDREFARRLTKEFDAFLKFNTKRSGRLKARALPQRLQNLSCLISLLVCFYRLTESEKYLNSANTLAEQLMEMQGTDGAFYSHKTHYTCVIYPAKSMLELALAEKEAGYEKRFARHYRSTQRAVEDLAKRLDNIETEGQMTFEDGMISCEALQIAFFALHTNDEDARALLTEKAEYIMRKHRCLVQTFAPDARIRGCTLRFWEARYDINFNANMLNSPHGWTSWKNYASYYLYLLTGKYAYLQELMDTMGACVQCIDDDGTLRWAFVPDPCIAGKQMVKANNRRGYAFEDTVVGEQYMPMISNWYRTNPKRFIHQYVINFSLPPNRLSPDYGGSCDNDVHEHFKCLAETLLAKAFIHFEEQQVFLYGCAQENEGFVSRGDKVRTLIVRTLHPGTILFDGVPYPVKQGINLLNI